MYEVGNKMAPVLHLGEEFSQSKPPTPLVTKSHSSVTKSSSATGSASIQTEGSGTTMSSADRKTEEDREI